MSDQERSRIDRFHAEFPKHALLGIILATFLLLQVEILSELGAADQHMDLAKVAAWTIVAYAFWPMISLGIDYADWALYEHVISRYWKVDR